MFPVILRLDSRPIFKKACSSIKSTFFFIYKKCLFRTLLYGYIIFRGLLVLIKYRWSYLRLIQWVLWFGFSHCFPRLETTRKKVLLLSSLKELLFLYESKSWRRKAVKDMEMSCLAWAFSQSTLSVDSLIRTVTYASTFLLGLYQASLKSGLITSFFYCTLW